MSTFFIKSSLLSCPYPNLFIVNAEPFQNNFCTSLLIVVSAFNQAMSSVTLNSSDTYKTPLGPCGFADLTSSRALNLLHKHSCHTMITDFDTTFHSRMVPPPNYITYVYSFLFSSPFHNCI